MKKFNKLQINTDKLITSAELLTLKGGDYTPGVLVCSGGEYGSCEFEVPGCIGAAASYCPLCPGGWTTAVCAGN